MDRVDALAAVGLVLVSIGCALIYGPLGLIVGGLGLIGLALLEAKSTATLTPPISQGEKVEE